MPTTAHDVVLGLNAYHGDASAALFVHGTCVAAAEEERFTRVKHQAGFPREATRWCLEFAGVKPGEIGHVAVSRNPMAHLARKVGYALRRRLSPAMVRDRLTNATRVMDTRRALAAALDVSPDDLRARFHRVEHHRAHLASAFFCSPFEEAACLSIDGMGDFCSTMWGRGRGNALQIDGRVLSPHSAGVYYTAFTQFLGLPKFGDEYKLMGLAAYGEPSFLPELREALCLGRDLQLTMDLDLFVHHTSGVDMTWADGAPELGPLWSARMAEVFGPARSPGAEVSARDQNLAASVQARLEEVVLEMIRRLHEHTQSPRLVMAGGVALNCVVNGKVRLETPFADVWVQPAANDSGTSIGAALCVLHEILGWPRSWEMRHAYLGPEYSDSSYKQSLEKAGLTYRRLPDEELVEHVARRVADGAVVGWFQGRMEFGPRALGNRSIVCDPRRADMKDLLNARIKHREPFRPFAPSILAERTADWFTQAYPSPYMLMAYEVQPSKRHLIPATTHADGTGRLQTVDAETNPLYHDLIEAFERLTGVPVVLNTSFNENEPICTRPEEAVDCFVRTRMDTLVLGNYVVNRNLERSGRCP